MAVLSSKQVYDIVIRAGGSAKEAALLTRIAQPESGYSTIAFNDKGKDLSYGLWQINMLGAMGPARRKTFGISSNEQLYNPLTNAKAALHILRTQGAPAAWKGSMGVWGAGGGAGEYIGGNQGTGGGGGGGAFAPAGLPPNASPAQIEAYVREHYPQAAGFLDIPELRKMLIEAARGEWTPEKLQGALQSTKWWRTNGDATRSYFALKSTDPAQLKALVDQKVAELSPMMAELGLTGFVGGEKGVRYVAEGALKYGWTPDQTRAQLAKMLKGQSAKAGVTQGSATDITADELMAIARTEYFVPVNRQDAEKWAIDIYSGRKTEESLRDYFGRLAASRFPGLAEQGFTPGDYMAPIRNVIAETLELSPQEVDLLDPRWSAVLEQEGKDGRLRPMSIAEAAKWARKQPKFLETKTAIDKASRLTGFLAQKMGVG